MASEKIQIWLSYVATRWVPGAIVCLLLNKYVTMIDSYAVEKRAIINFILVKIRHFNNISTSK